MTRHNILRSAFVVSIMTALSRVTGLLREMLMAHLFGTSLIKSAFDVAFQFPNLFRNLLGEGALSAAFIPVFSESIKREGSEKAHELAGRAFTLLASVLLFIVALGIIASAVAVEFLPADGKAAAVLPLLRIMLPYAFFICLTALCMAILNTYQRFAVAAFTPVLMNLAMIFTLVVICPWYGGSAEQRIYVAAWGVVSAGVLQFIFQVPSLSRVGFNPTLSFNWRDARIVKVLSLMAPVALGLGVFQINVFVGGVLAIVAAPWAPASLTYAQRLIYLPLGLFGTAMGTVLLPAFSKQASEKNHAEILSTMNLALRNLIFLMLPASIGLLVLADPIVRLVFAWTGGSFSEESVFLTARAVRFYAPGLVFFSMYKVFAPAFYALKDMRTPVRVGLWVVLLNFLLNVLSITVLPLYYKHAGMALATVIASFVNCLVLGWLLHFRLGSPGWRGIASCASRSSVATALLGVVSYSVCGMIDRNLEGFSAKLTQLASVGGGVAAGMAVYGALAMFTMREELSESLSALRRRRKTPAVPSEQKDY